MYRDDINWPGYGRARDAGCTGLVHSCAGVYSSETSSQDPSTGRGEFFPRRRGQRIWSWPSRPRTSHGGWRGFRTIRAYWFSAAAQAQKAADPIMGHTKALPVEQAAW